MLINKQQKCCWKIQKNPPSTNPKGKSWLPSSRTAFQSKIKWVYPRSNSSLLSKFLTSTLSTLSLTWESNQRLIKSQYHVRTKTPKMCFKEACQFEREASRSGQMHKRSREMSKQQEEMVENETPEPRYHQFVWEPSALTICSTRVLRPRSLKKWRGCRYLSVCHSIVCPLKLHEIDLSENKPPPCLVLIDAAECFLERIEHWKQVIGWVKILKIGQNSLPKIVLS